MTLITLTFFILTPGLPTDITQTEKYIYATTLAFTTLVILELFNAINSKSETKYFWQNLLSNKTLLIAIATSFTLQLIVLYTFTQAFKVTPLPLQLILLIIISSSVVLITDTIFKKLNRKHTIKHAN